LSLDLTAAQAVLTRAIDAHVFPGAAFSVVHHSAVTTGALGQFTYDTDSPSVSPETIYDVASLTKVLATTAMAMLLYDGGKLKLEVPLVEIVPEFVQSEPDPRRRTVTLRMLLAHSSGLPAYEKLFLRAHGRDEMLRAAYAVPLTADPGTRAEYSDIGFMLLGIVLERLAGEPLDTFCSREIFAPLAMHETMFRPGEEFLLRIPPSENDREFRHKMVCGEVNDENAWVLGGVAGHAGLFSKAAGIAKFASCMLRNGAPIFKSETVELFTRRESSPSGTSRALGWDTPSQPSSSGKYFSPRSFGHLGFTGTSLWIDPERDVAITLLTNRTWPDRGSQDGIRRVRPAFHDAVVEALFPNLSP
jgi:CubicO group peptidase (beta-lactamase class C family)